MEVTITGIDRLAKRLQKYADIKGKLSEIAKRLAAVGEPIIKATHERGGNRVWTEQTPNGYKVCAKGADILFVEFGTGDAAGAENQKYDQVPVVVYPGSWSEKHKGEYARTGGYNVGYWHFGGKKYTETPPHPAFYEAYEAMIQALPQIVNEVFK